MVLMMQGEGGDPREKPLGDIFAGKSVIVGHSWVAIAIVELMNKMQFGSNITSGKSGSRLLHECCRP